MARLVAGALAGAFTGALVVGATVSCTGEGPPVPPVASAPHASAPGTGSAPASAGAPPPAVGSRRVQVRDVTVTAEVADTAEERRRGLMWRTSLAPGTGMIFVFDEVTRAGFYMFQTKIPLSIMFVRDGRVVGVREMTPCPDRDPSACPIYYADGPYTLAVEAPARTFSGVRAGDPVTIGPG